MLHMAVAFRLKVRQITLFIAPIEEVIFIIAYLTVRYAVLAVVLLVHIIIINGCAVARVLSFVIFFIFVVSDLAIFKT